MAAFNSALSQFKWATVTIPAIGSVSMSLPRPAVDVTPIGSWNTYFIKGVMSGTIGLDIYYNKTDHKALVDALLTATGSSTAFQLILNSTQTTPGTFDDVITGAGIVTSFDVVSSTADVVRASIVIQIYGQLNINGTAVTYGNAETPPA